MMSKWALINDGLVHEITEDNPAGRYHPALVWIDVSDITGIEVGWLYQGGTFSIPPASGTSAATIRSNRDALIAATAWRYERYARETRLGLSTTDDIAVLDAYIQKLADLPTQAGFPAAVKWPEPLL